VQKECEERVAVLVRAMAEVEGVDEEMKENEQMEWVRRMEMIRGRVEDVVREEIME
jgi:DNA polymerase II small subunit/DNA polymerase delta subunit B